MEQTPKEKFDAEMKQMNNTLAPEKQAGFSDKEVEEHEEEVEAINDEIENFDKSMGETKVEVTKEQFMQQAQEKEKNDVLNRLAQVGGLKANALSTEQVTKIQSVMKLERDGKLTDPVLKHMLVKKVKLAQEKLKLDAQAKEMQMKLIAEFGKLADATIKCVSATNAFNDSILEYLEENPDTLSEDDESKA